MLLALGPLHAIARAGFQTPEDYTPASDHAQVVAQGIAELPQEELFWRVVRYQAELPAEAPFVEQPIGFVVAERAPLLLADQNTGRLTRLGPGEAAFVPAGTTQQRASLAERPGGYLAIELVPAAAPTDTGDGNVLSESNPFAATPGFHDLDLVRDMLTGGETLLVPNTGERGVILPTEGAVSVGPPGGSKTTLLGGEAAVFAGEVEVGVAVAGETEPTADDRAVFVVALIGPTVEPPLLPTPTAGPERTPEPGNGGDGTGTIAVQVFSCPPGMRPETLAVAVCGPAAGDFDVTLSGEALGTTLTLVDATEENGAFVWTDLPFGDYLLAEALLPVGYDTYVVAAAGAQGSPETGFTFSLTADQPDLTVRIYNFAPAPTGSITVQLFLCPRGMGPDNLVANACRSVEQGFDFALAGDALDQPLTIADATPGNPFTWQTLPFGEYSLTQTVLPEGFASYLVRGQAGIEPSPAGYLVTIDEEVPDLLLRAYDFRSA
jgi:hypothetical protein